jgi:hypothetical protein
MKRFSEKKWSGLLTILLCGTLGVQQASAQKAAPQVQASKTANKGLVASKENFTSFVPEQHFKSDEVMELNKGYERHPELGVLYPGTPCKECYELLDKRTEKTKTFAAAGSRGTHVWTQSSSDPMHYRNQAGQWITIQEKIKPGEITGVYATQQSPYPVTINTSSGFTSIKTNQDEIVFNNRLELIYTDPNGTDVSLGMGNWSDYTAGEDGVYVRNFWPGIDLQVYAYRGSAKTNFIVNSAMPQYAQGQLKVRDTWDLSNGLHFAANETGPFTNAIEILNAQGVKAYHVNQAVAYEQNNAKATAIALSYERLGNRLDISVPGEMLSRPLSSYPLVIDPLVTQASSATIAGASYALLGIGGCTVVIPVAIPPKITITDMLETFTFVTNNGVGTGYAAFSFALGTCKNPSASGVVGWSCYPTGGPQIPGYPAGTTCGGTQSIFSDFSRCLPQPKCIPDTVFVTFTFLQQYLPTAACVTTYAAATTPVTITIQGHTVEDSLITSSSAGDTICLGSSATLSATPKYGVPPYSYTWTPGGLTGNPVIVTPGTTTTYKVTIKDLCNDSAISNIQVTVLNPPAPTVTSPVYLCMDGPSSPLTAVGSNLRWYTLAAGGAGSSTAPTPSTATPATYTYYVSQTINGCESPRKALTVIVRDYSDKPTVTDRFYCQGDIVPPLTAVGQNLMWYTVPTGGVGFPTAVSGGTISP